MGHRTHRRGLNDLQGQVPVRRLQALTPLQDVRFLYVMGGKSLQMKRVQGRAMLIGGRSERESVLGVTVAAKWRNYSLGAPHPQRVRYLLHSS